MDAINLTESIRNNLLTLQSTARVREQSSRQLASGLKVQRAVDDAVSYFQARTLTDRVSDLFEVKHNIGQALSATESSLVGVEALDRLASQMRGIALSVRGGTAEDRAAVAQQYDELRTQLGNLANDTSYQGTSLINSNPDNLTVRLNETGTSEVTIEGSSSDAEGLGIQSAAGSFGSFATDANIDAAAAQIDSALSQLRSNASSFGSDVALLSVREDFTDRLSQTLETGAGKLINADLNESAAVQLSSQVRQQLGTNTLRLAAEAEQLVVQLLFP